MNTWLDRVWNGVLAIVLACFAVAVFRAHPYLGEQPGCPLGVVSLACSSAALALGACGAAERWASVKLIQAALAFLAVSIALKVVMT